MKNNVFPTLGGAPTGPTSELLDAKTVVHVVVSYLPYMCATRRHRGNGSITVGIDD